MGNSFPKPSTSRVSVLRLSKTVTLSLALGTVTIPFLTLNIPNNKSHALTLTQQQHEHRVLLSQSHREGCISDCSGGEKPPETVSPPPE